MSRLRLRGGFAGGESAPPDYGPTDGKDWVIANVGPRFVSKPTGAIDISPPGGMTQAVLDAAAADAVFWLLPGTHTSIRGAWDTGLVPQSGQTIAAPSDGSCVIDGGGWACGLGRGAITVANVSNVTIRGGKWTNYGWDNHPSDDPNYAWHSPFHLGPGWVVEDADVTGNNQSGTHSGGNTSVHGLTIRYCNFTDNGRYGSAFGGMSGDWATNVAFEHNYVAENNWGLYNRGHDAGGSKWGAIGSGVWRYNYFTENYGFDCWFDTAVMDVDVTENVLIKTIDPTYPALSSPFHWEDCGPGWFRRNYVEMIGDFASGDTANAGVRIVSADGLRYSNSVKKEYEVSQNIIYSDGDLWSWCIWHQDGGSGYPRHTPRSVWFHHNDVYQPSTATGRCGGGVTSISMIDAYEDFYTLGGDIKHYTNRYHVGNTSAAMWAYGYPSPQQNKTWAQWQALNPGNGCTFDTDSELLTYTGPP